MHGNEASAAERSLGALTSLLTKARARLVGRLNAARLRRAPWVSLAEAILQMRSSAGRGRLWTRLRQGRDLHQITDYTAPDRYPDLFDLAQQLRPDADQILSFGCSTGEEIESIRRRFPKASIVGVEINARSRAIAKDRMASDGKARVETACLADERFDIIFAMAVLQYKPDWVERLDVQDLAPHYPFAKFEAEILRLADRLTPGGLLCILHAHYRVEDTRAASRLLPVGNSLRDDRLYRPDGTRYPVHPPTSSLFVALAEGRHDSDDRAFS